VCGERLGLAAEFEGCWEMRIGETGHKDETTQASRTGAAFGFAKEKKKGLRAAHADRWLSVSIPDDQMPGISLRGVVSTVTTISLVLAVLSASHRPPHIFSASTVSCVLSSLYECPDVYAIFHTRHPLRYYLTAITRRVKRHQGSGLECCSPLNATTLHSHLILSK
jgi:hypothetical protein